MIEKIRVSLYGFKKYSNLLRELVIRDIKVRYRRSFLGILWTVLNPLLMMVVITFIFSYMFRYEIPNYPVYFLTGNIIFQFFNEATTQAQHSIIGNSALIKKVYIPKYLFPLSRILSSVVNLGFSFIAMIIVMIITDAPFYPTILLVLMPLFYFLMFVTGFGLILSAISVYFRDLIHVYSVITLAWMYFTPIFYPMNALPDLVKKVMNFNPLWHYVNYFRQLILDGIFPDLRLNAICFLTGFVFLILGLVVFYKKQDNFILYI